MNPERPRLSSATSKDLMSFWFLNMLLLPSGFACAGSVRGGLNVAAETPEIPETAAEGLRGILNPSEVAKTGQSDIGLSF
jgi:hypothetical protein